MDTLPVRAALDALDVEISLAKTNLVNLGQTLEATTAELAAAKQRIVELEALIDPGEPVPPPPPPPAGYGVLYNADTDQPIANLADGETYPIGGRNINIVAIPTDGVSPVPASVRFTHNDAVVRTENNRPWAMWSDTAGNLDPKQLAAGQHLIKMEFFSDANAAGSLLGTASYTINVVAATDPVPMPDPPPPPPPDPVPVPDGEGEVITSASALVAAVKAGGNRVLVMPPGSYGSVNLAALGSTSSRVVIKSANPSDPARFSGFDLKAAKNITLDNLIVEKSSSSGPLITISDSHGITVVRCIIRALGGQGHVGVTGILSNSSCRDVTIGSVRTERNWFQDISWGYAGGGINIKIMWNWFTGMGADCVQLGSGTTGGEIAYNFGRDWNPPSGSHPDGIQYGSWAGNPSRDLWAHHNVFWRGRGASFQGFWNGNEGSQVFTNTRIEHNIINNTHAHGIRPAMGGGAGLLVRNNTAISTNPGSIQTAIAITQTGADVNVTRNIANSMTSSATESYALGSSPNYGSVFVNHQPGVYTLENFRVKPGITAGADVDQLVDVVR